SVLAVLRLPTKSNFVGCKIGRSSGYFWVEWTPLWHKERQFARGATKVAASLICDTRVRLHCYACQMVRWWALFDRKCPRRSDALRRCDTVSKRSALMGGAMYSVLLGCRPCPQFARLRVRLVVRRRNEVHCAIARRGERRPFGRRCPGRSDSLRRCDTVSKRSALMGGAVYSVLLRCRPCRQFARLRVRLGVRRRNEVHRVIGRRGERRPFGRCCQGRSDALRLDFVGREQVVERRNVLF